MLIASLLFLFIWAIMYSAIMLSKGWHIPPMQQFQLKLTVQCLSLLCGPPRSQGLLTIWLPHIMLLLDKLLAEQSAASSHALIGPEQHTLCNQRLHSLEMAGMQSALAVATALS